MTRRAVWTTAFLSVAAVWTAMECWAAFDGSPDTDPATYLIRDHLPPALTFALIALLAAHMHSAYAQKGIDVTQPVPPTPDPTDRPASEPLLTRAGWTALGAAVIGVLVSMHWVHLNDAQTTAALTVVGIVGPLVAAWLARKHVWSPAQVARAVARERADCRSKHGPQVHR